MRRIWGAKLEIALLVAGLALRVAYALTVRGENVFSGWDGKDDSVALLDASRFSPEAAPEDDLVWRGAPTADSVAPKD